MVKKISSLSFFWLFLFNSLTALLFDIHRFFCALHRRLPSVNMPITRGNTQKNYKFINEFGLDYAEDVLDISDPLCRCFRHF
jgi:hypothetical protein